MSRLTLVNAHVIEGAAHAPDGGGPRHSGLTLAGMPKLLRAVAVYRTEVDVDMVAAGPTLLYEVATQHAKRGIEFLRIAQYLLGPPRNLPQGTKQLCEMPAECR